jgi:hypothetical protein
LLSPDDPRAPKYWRNETGGKLGPAVERYILRRTEQPDDTLWIRAYLRQWIDSPVWAGSEDVEQLRQSVRSLASRAEIDAWIQRAVDINIDPL